MERNVYSEKALSSENFIRENRSEEFFKQKKLKENNQS